MAFTKFILSMLMAIPARPANLDMPPEQRVPIRQNIKNCETYLLLEDSSVDDSVGIPFSSNRLDEFRSELNLGLANYGLEKFRDARFYVVGVPRKDRLKTQRAYEDLTVESGLATVNAQIVILDVPTELVSQESVSLARRVLERTLYFFPSIKKDLQKPQLGELVSSFSTSALQEMPNMVFLFHRMPVGDALLTVTSQTIILSSMLIYEKSLINWILRNSSTTERGRRLEMFLKSMTLSMPFVLSYNVFGNFSKIVDFYAQNGWSELVKTFPEDVANFAATQGLTTFLQALFFSQVINSGTSAWMNRQIGDENTRDARTLRPWLELPVLAVDAFLLGLASSGQAEVLYHAGPISVNSGHVALASLTSAGALLFYCKPNFLNPPLVWYQNLKAFVAKLRDRTKIKKSDL